MIDWRQFPQDCPIINGQYLVYCVAPQFDSAWVDIARFDDGKWHQFNSPMSDHVRVRYWAKLNRPLTNAERTL